MGGVKKVFYRVFLAARALFDPIEETPCPKAPGSTMIAVFADRAFEKWG